MKTSTEKPPAIESKPWKRMIKLKKIRLAQHKYGWKGDLNMSVLRSMPCARRALWNLRYAIQIETHVKRVEIVVKFWNHSNALLEPVEPAERYVKPEMDAVMATHQYGTPVFEQ